MPAARLRGVDASHPGLRAADLIHGRQAGRPIPDPVEPLHADLLDHLRHELLAEVVLADLDVEADGPLEGLLHPGTGPALMKDPNAMIDVLKEKSHYLIGFAVVIGALYWLMTWMQRRAAARQA